jgi:hypothetical protein
MAKITNVFIKGLNRDLAISNNTNETVYYSLDFDLATQNGTDLGVPHNTLGNSLVFSIPDLPAVWTVELDGTLGTGYFTVNGLAPPLVVPITAETTIQDVYDAIVGGYASLISAGVFGVFYNNNQVYLVGYTGTFTAASSGGLVSTQIVAAQTDLSIIGWCQLDEHIILLTTSKNNTSATPSNTAGQVWKITFDDATNTVTNLSGTSLDPQYHLVKNDILNFSLAHEVYREMIGRVESTDKGSVYWTDFYNNPRALNIYNPQAAAIPPGLLDWKPEINTSTPIINGILNGGNLKVGSYQFSYQCYSADGAISSYSPLSTLIPITDSPFGTTNYVDFDGAEAGTNGGKSIRLLIPNIDRRFDYIRIAAVSYEVQNVPVIYSIIDQPITDDSMEFLYTGNENKVSLSVAQFVNPNISFDTCKTFTQKKDRLYPANTRSEKFELDWDSRAYRFSGGANATKSDGTPVALGSTYLYSRDGTGTVYNLAGLTGISDSLDLVNAYNDESGQIFGLEPGNDYDTSIVNWVGNFQFKYQSDGTTFGGEGPNIKYEFFSKTYVGDSDITTIPSTSPFINVISINAGGTTQDIFQPDIAELEPTTDGWDAIKNPFYSMTFPSYARGEVYRFGIVAYNDKGQQSFVNWIGDIRIPEPWESPADYILTDSNGTNQELKAIGITFTIDTSSLPSDITGFRIVRCERTDDDKTRYGVGISIGAWSTSVRYADLPPGTTTPSWVLARKTEVGGVAIGQELLNLDINVDFRNTETNQLGVIKFPDFDFDKYQIGQASHVKKFCSYNVRGGAINGDQTGIGNIYWASDDNSATSTPWMNAMLHKTNTIDAASIVSTIVNIQKQTGIGIDGQVLASFSPGVMGTDDYNHVVPFLTTVGPEYEVCALGTKMLFVSYTTGGMEDATLGAEDRYQLVALCRFNQGAYGGPWRSARYNNVYQSCSDFIPKDLYDPTSQAITVWGGDVYLSYYLAPLFFFHWKEDYGVPTANPSGLASKYDPVAATQFALAVAFPTEASFNTDLRHGQYFNKNQLNQFVPGTGPDPTINKSDSFAKFLSDDFFYNDAYSQENNLLPYFPKPFLISNDEENRVRVWSSNLKFDREIVDSWRIYPVNQYRDLEGMYGPINKIVNLKEQLYIYQDRAIAGISSEELATVPNASGAVLQAGTGALLARYDYVSKDTGAFHQHSVVVAANAIFHYDIRLQKLFKLGQGLSPLSDIGGLAAFFRENVLGDVQTTDQVLLGKGVHGVYDSKYNKAYFTFEKTIDFTYATATINSTTGNVTYTGYPEEFLNLYSEGQVVTIGTSDYYIISISKDELVLSGLIPQTPVARTAYIRFTIAYNEFLQTFEGFYSFTPSIYLGTGKRLLSANPYDEANSVYMHNYGNYGEFYDRNPSVSKLQYIMNYPDKTKIPTFRLDNLEFWTQVTDNQNQNITLESITGIKIENDYQTTANSLYPLTLGPQGNYTLVDVERTWKTNRIFDYTDTTKRILPYFRDKYSLVSMYYDNQLNRNFKLHNISANITLSY